mgnify:CR=1 FL=1
MRIVIQRVSDASVSIGGTLHSAIGRGLLVLVGVEEGDTPADARWLADKTAALRIFPDEAGVMNRSVTDVEGEILAVSPFTARAIYAPPVTCLRRLCMTNIAKFSSSV